jgi:hypothetical protein
MGRLQRKVIKNVERIGLGLFEGVPAVTWRDRKRHSRYGVKKPRFEPVPNFMELSPL